MEVDEIEKWLSQIELILVCHHPDFRLPRVCHRESGFHFTWNVEGSRSRMAGS